MIEMFNGEILKLRRRDKGWTQVDICNRTGLSKNQVIAMEKGRFTGGIKYLQKYLDAVDLQIILE